LDCWFEDAEPVWLWENPCLGWGQSTPIEFNFWRWMGRCDTRECRKFILEQLGRTIGICFVGKHK
jgi:hypothetical protein